MQGKRDIYRSGTVSLEDDIFFSHEFCPCSVSDKGAQSRYFSIDFYLFGGSLAFYRVRKFYNCGAYDIILKTSRMNWKNAGQWS